MTTRFDKFQQFRNYYSCVLYNIIDAHYSNIDLAEKLVIDQINFIDEECVRLNMSNFEFVAIVVQFINTLKLDCRSEFIDHIKQTVQFDKLETSSQKFWNAFDTASKRNKRRYTNSYNNSNDSWMINMTCF